MVWGGKGPVQGLRSEPGAWEDRGARYEAGHAYARTRGTPAVEGRLHGRLHAQLFTRSLLGWKEEAKI